MLSQTAEYALRAMTCLALADARLTPTPELAEATRVPANYLAKVLQQLAAADLITGRRGVGGGYRLARSADTISLLDVISAVGRLERSDLDTPTVARARDAIGVLDQTLDKVLQQTRDRLSRTTLDQIAASSSGPDGPTMPLPRASPAKPVWRNGDAPTPGLRG